MVLRCYPSVVFVAFQSPSRSNPIRGFSGGSLTFTTVHECSKHSPESELPRPPLKLPVKEQAVLRITARDVDRSLHHYFVAPFNGRTNILS
jgi:hypothetical protein